METARTLLAGHTAPYEVEINELVATDLKANDNRVNVGVRFNVRVR